MRNVLFAVMAAIGAAAVIARPERETVAVVALALLAAHSS